MWRRWLTGFWLIAFLASSAAAMGVPGLIIAGYLLSVVSVIWFWRAGKKGVAKGMLGVVIGVPVFVVLFVLPTISASREAGRRMSCANNLKQIAAAVLSYHEAYGCFPPACLCDENGKPMHSWRVLILPFMDRDDVYKKYSFKERWNGPNNR